MYQINRPFSLFIVTIEDSLCYLHGACSYISFAITPAHKESMSRILFVFFVLADMLFFDWKNPPTVDLREGIEFIYWRKFTVRSFGEFVVKLFLFVLLLMAHDDVVCDNCIHVFILWKISKDGKFSKLCSYVVLFESKTIVQGDIFKKNWSSSPKHFAFHNAKTQDSMKIHQKHVHEQIRDSRKYLLFSFWHAFMA